MQDEKIFLLMDGAASPQELKTLRFDRDLLEKWHHYHLIRETLCGNVHESTVTLDLVDSIAKAIEMESLPQHNKKEKFSFASQLKNLSQHFSKWFIPAGQVGLAACSALVVIFGVSHYQNQNEEIDFDVPALATNPVGVNVQPVGYDSFNPAVETNQSNKLYLILQDYEQQRRVYESGKNK